MLLRGFEPPLKVPKKNDGLCVTADELHQQSGLPPSHQAGASVELDQNLVQGSSDEVDDRPELSDAAKKKGTLLL
jgi:hypothetical protein